MGLLGLPFTWCRLTREQRTRHERGLRLERPMGVPAVERGSLQTGYTHQRVRHIRIAGTPLLLGAERLQIPTA